MTSVFFYGLFMDEDLLRNKGFSPSPAIVSCVRDYGLRIGERATLVPATGEHTWGTVMSLTDDDLARLYGEQSVADYKSVPVTAHTLEHNAIAAVVYVLPADKLAGQNSKYLSSLIAVTRKLDLPAEYIEHLELLAAARQ